MHTASINTRQLGRYLRILTDVGLLTFDRSGRLYAPTEQGRLYLKTYERYAETLDLMREQRKAVRGFFSNSDLPREKLEPFRRSPAASNPF